MSVRFRTLRWRSEARAQTETYLQRLWTISTVDQHASFEMIDLFCLLFLVKCFFHTRSARVFSYQKGELILSVQADVSLLSSSTPLKRLHSVAISIENTDRQSLARGTNVCRCNCCCWRCFFVSGFTLKNVKLQWPVADSEPFVTGLMSVKSEWLTLNYDFVFSSYSLGHNMRHGSSSLPQIRTCTSPSPMLPNFPSGGKSTSTPHQFLWKNCLAKTFRQNAAIGTPFGKDSSSLDAFGNIIVFYTLPDRSHGKKSSTD